MKTTLIEKITIATIVSIILFICSGVYVSSLMVSKIKESSIESNRFIKDNNCKILEKTDGLITKEKYICDKNVKYER